MVRSARVFPSTLLAGAHRSEARSAAASAVCPRLTGGDARRGEDGINSRESAGAGLSGSMSVWLRALVGALAWIGFVAFRVPGLVDATWATALLLFAALVLVPIALDLFRD